MEVIEALIKSAEGQLAVVKLDTLELMRDRMIAEINCPTANQSATKLALAMLQAEIGKR